MTNTTDKAMREARQAGDVMASAHALCPTDMPHRKRMEWMAGYFQSNHQATQARPDAEDAARYRWLRGKPESIDAPCIDVVHWQVEDESVNSGTGLRGDELDAAIDAARAVMASDAGERT